MKRRHGIPLLFLALLSIVLSTTTNSQTKPSATRSPKKLTSVAAKAIPTIKCIDLESMVACKSFKQLVDARDKGLLDSLTGGKDSRKRHFAYVCLRPKDDAFKIVEFDAPLPEEYRSYSPQDAARSFTVLLQENEAFPYKEGMPVMQHLDAQKKWYEDHDDIFQYGFGNIYMESWEQGILANYVSDSGKWRRPLSQGSKYSDEDVYFESAHQWLAKFNEANANQLSAVDEREYPRITVGDTSIYLRYSFKNKNNDYTDYTLNIQRSTGRFTES
ncbi:MAG: hypothetical protein ABSE82_14485, partial [Nitrososphaerales archaeon]